MADLESLDLGFAEFVAKLISEVVYAVAASQLEQEQRQAELSAAARLSPEEVEAEPRPLLAAPLRPIGALTGTPERLTLPDVRLVVRQADDRSPQASTIQANVYGEVDVTFKTVT